MKKSILLIHGRGFKPPKLEMQRMWIDAIKHGISRDHPEKLPAFAAAKLEMVYYGDISNQYLQDELGQTYKDDLPDRKQTLEQLKRYSKSQFSKSNYRNLPGYNPWRETLANLFSSPLDYFGLTESLIEKLAPDIGEYWKCYPFGSDVRSVFTRALIRAMKRGGDICVIAHSLGSLISYDVFWKLSHYGEYRNEPWNRQIDLWITLGSPIAADTVRDNLKGARNSEADRYPKNVMHWLNVSAEDDYICYEPKVAEAFRNMKRLGNTKTITDKRIHNLSVRHGASNPHHSAGYLIHPKVISAIADWI